jgi:glycosyltransferase involved in cell wall biosynthesis
LAKILIVGNPKSSLIRARGVIGQQAGHDVSWFSAWPANLEGVLSFSLPKFARNAIGRAIFEPIFLSRILKKVQPDIVHVHYASKGLSAIPLSRQKKLIVSVMGSDIMSEVGYQGVYAPLTRQLLKSAAIITSKSTYMDQVLQKIGNFAKKIERITWGIDLRQFHPGRDVKGLRDRLKIPAGSLVFFEPRSAKPLYNKHVLVSAFAKYVEAKGPPAILVLASGDANEQYLNKLKQEIETQNLSRLVRILNSLTSDEMADAFCLADVTISVPRSDGFSQSVFEALACGSYLILGDLPQYADIFDQQIGIQPMPVGETGLLAEGLLWAARHPEERIKRARSGREYAESNADKEKESKRVLGMYQKLLAR